MIEFCEPIGMQVLTKAANSVEDKAGTNGETISVTISIQPEEVKDVLYLKVLMINQVDKFSLEREILPVEQVKGKIDTVHGKTTRGDELTVKETKTIAQLVGFIRELETIK